MLYVFLVRAKKAANSVRPNSRERRYMLVGYDWTRAVIQHLYETRHHLPSATDER